MTRATFLFCIGCTVAVFTIMPVLVDGIMCAVCRTDDHGCEGGDVPASLCSPEYDKCYTLNIYVLNGGVGTTRGCSNQTFSNGICKTVRRRTFEGTVCVQLCDWDGCNSALGVGPRLSSLRKRSPSMVVSPSLISKLSPPLIRKKSASLSRKRQPFVITERLASSIKNWRR